SSDSPRGESLTPAATQGTTSLDDAGPLKFLQMLPFDPLRAAEALWRSLLLAVVCAIALGATLMMLARSRVEATHTASMQLVKQVLPDSFRASLNGESYRPADIPVTLLTTNIMLSRSLMERVAPLTTPPVDADTLRSGLSLATDKKTDVITVTYTSGV
ncbi:MAG: hypothetical protein ACOYMN_21885, partial [Roseimicrobium sp.]